MRIEMDEDFMADPEQLFYWKSEASSGHGALDDFGVHGLSLIWVLFGGVRRVCGHMAKPYVDRPVKDGGRRAVETYDIATMLIELDNGASGVIALNRSAWGRKGRIFVQLFGAKGTIVYDQERMNEVQLYTADGPKESQGFRTILAGPASSALRQIHSGAGPWARLQRSEDHRMPRADPPHRGRARASDRIRGRHPHRANSGCDCQERP